MAGSAPKCPAKVREPTRLGGCVGRSTCIPRYRHRGGPDEAGTQRPTLTNGSDVRSHTRERSGTNKKEKKQGGDCVKKEVRARLCELHDVQEALPALFARAIGLILQNRLHRFHSLASMLL